MDDSSPVMSMSLPTGVAGQTRASLRQPARPVLAYDPTVRPPERAFMGRVTGPFFCRMPLIWLCAATIGVVAGATLALTNPLVYTATGLLRGLGTDASQDEAAIIQSDEVIRGVVDRLGISRVAPHCLQRTALAAACATADVKAQLQVRIASNPNGIEHSPMLRLTATHTDPAIAVAMLDAAVAIDARIWRAAHPADRADALDPQLAAAQNALDQTATDMARIRAQAHVTTIAQDVAQATAETNAIARHDSDLRLRLAAISAELKAAQTALQTAPETVLDSREVRGGDPGQDLRAALLQLKLQRAHMVQLYARDYPGVAELDRKIETIEAASKIQAKTTTSVIRDVRNPVVAALAAKTAALGAERAGLIQQRQELQDQLAASSTRETSLRGAEQLLSVLQQRQGTQEAVVRQLTLSAANLRSQDLLNVSQLAQRRLLQRPEAVVVPWSGTQAAVVAGTAIGMIYGLVLSLLAWRRRFARGAVQGSRLALERLDGSERAWMPPATSTPPQVMVVPLPPSFGPRTPPSPTTPEISSGGGSLANALATAASMHTFGAGWERHYKSLRVEDLTKYLAANSGG